MCDVIKKDIWDYMDKLFSLTIHLVLRADCLSSLIQEVWIKFHNAHFESFLGIK